MNRRGFLKATGAAAAMLSCRGALAKALKNSSQLRDPKTIKAWLYRILSNCWHDHFRRSKDTVDIDDIVLIEKTTPDSSHDRQQIIDRVRNPSWMAPLKM